MTNLAAPCAIVDSFLPQQIAAQLLDEMIAAAPLFTPSLVGGPDKGADSPGIRSSLRLPGRVGVDLTVFREAIAANSSRLCVAIGIQPFPVYHTECSIVAHGDRHFYRTHIDTRTGQREGRSSHVRVVSCVYYLHREPKAFFGGALKMHGLGERHSTPSSASIEPMHNRLVAFPSFIPHEVEDITCPSKDFDDSRFSINCWLHR